MNKCSAYRDIWFLHSCSVMPWNRVHNMDQASCFNIHAIISHLYSTRYLFCFTGFQRWCEPNEDPNGRSSAWQINLKVCLYLKIYRTSKKLIINEPLPYIWLFYVSNTNYSFIHNIHRISLANCCRLFFTTLYLEFQIKQ